MRLPHRLALLVPLTLFTNCGDSSPPTPSGDNVPKLQAITFWNKTSAVATGDVAEASRAYVKASPALTAAGGDWQVRAVVADPAGNRHVRLRQLHDGVRVWGGDVVVHTEGTRFTAVKGNLVKNLDNFDTEAAVAAETALTSAKGDYSKQLKFPSATGPEFAREQTELVIFPQKDRDARLAWRVVFFTEAQGGMAPGLWNYFIDAKDGKILYRYNNVQTLEQASGPGGNAKVPRTWTDALDVEPDGAGAFKMDTAKLQTLNMQNSTTTGVVVTGPLDPIGDAAINDAHGFAEVTLNMMSEWMGFNSIDNNGFVIKSRVHYDSNFENAFWDGEQMTYGDGATTFHPLSGDVDVVAHEVSHGFTTFHSNLIYAGQSGGMNEAFSDIAGTVAEFFMEGTAADFDIGRDIFKGDAALRFMCNPPQDGISIDHFSNFTESMDVHFSSGIMNKAFCLQVQRLGTGTEATVDSVKKVGQAYYQANASHWVESSTFQQGCQGTLDAARALNFTEDELTIMRDSWKDVGVFCDGLIEPIVCDETFTTDTGEVTSPNFPQDYPDNFNRTFCIQPASGQPATLTFESFNTEQGFDFVTVKDVNGTAQTTSGTQAPTPVTSTLIAIKFTSDSVVTAPGWRATWTTGGTENQPPTVAITSPADGADVSNTIAITATAADADGTVSKVVFALPDGTTVEDDTAPFGASWDTKTVADGTHEITATAVDNLGVSSEPASVDVNVENGAGCLSGTFEAAGLPMSIPDNNSTGIASLVGVSGAGNVGALQLSATITHTWRGDLTVTLVSPDGFQHVVHDRTGGSADNLVLANVDITAFNGRVAAGLWQLRVTDGAGQDVGTLDRWSISIVGNCAPSGDWSGKAEPNLPLVDNGSACSTLTVNSATGDASTAHLDVDGVHDFRSILRATLTHNGVTVDAFPTGTFPTGAGSFSLGNRPITGLAGDVNGEWTLCIIDTDAFGDTGTLTSWSVHD